MTQYTVSPIAHIENGFKEKFGIPRQSGLTELISKIVFEPAYARREAIRGIEGFSHLWLLWIFSENPESSALTVRPPRLGGNRRVGVFATRSPFRPNRIGLSCVQLTAVTEERGAPVLLVQGADLMDGTPIIDIKPYIPYSDCRPEALSGFAEKEPRLTARIPDGILDDADIPLVRELLEQDPRPAYQDDPERVYTFTFRDMELSFRAEGNEIVLLSAEKH